MLVEGYASATSVLQGAKIEFCLSTGAGTPSGRTRLRIENVVNSRTGISVVRDVGSQDIPSRAWLGFGWSPTFEYEVPIDAPPGLYRLINQTTGTTQHILSFVVLPRHPGRVARTLVHISYLTPAAYTSSGGRSLYWPREGRPRVRAQKVSLGRPSPYPRLAHDSSPDVYINEAKLLNWLREEDIAVECCSSIELHDDPNLLDNYDCLVLAFHDEYWTKAMRDHCERFIRNGGNLIVLSGNTCYRQVRLEDDNRTVVFYKYANDDPMKDINSDEVSIVWSEPPVNRPPNDMLGVGFTHGAFSLAAGDHRSMTIRFPDHWVFEGVGAQRQTSAFVHYETDAAAYVEEPEGYPRVTGEEQTPLNLTVLATADLRDWHSKPGRATMSIHSRNGTVFNAATTNWINALSSDPVVTQVTKNVFERLSTPTPWNWELVGHARNATAMAAAEGKLFLTTSENELWRRHPVGADVPWLKIGHANNVTSMTAMDGYLFCVTNDNLLWARRPHETDVGWQRIGRGPTDGIRSLAAASGLLYAVDRNGVLHRRPAVPASREFTPMTAFAPQTDIVAMSAYSDILFATTSNNRLLRSDEDFIGESKGWTDLLHCNGSIGLATIEWMLYVATTDDGLWRLDLTGLSQP